MRIVEIVALENGAHRNQIVDGVIPVPDGFAVIPDDMECKNFPFGEVTAEEIDGVMTVTNWIAGVVPEPEFEIELEPTQMDKLEAQVAYTAMMTDTLLEV